MCLPHFGCESYCHGNTLWTQWSILLPVSYTHLDVYKRQSLWSADGCHLAAGQGAGLEVCHSGFGLWIKCAVTKMPDVYKRQVLGRQEPVSTAHGMDYTVNPIEGLELSDQLHDAVMAIAASQQNCIAVDFPLITRQSSGL